jgi:hypothetical protein
MRAGGPARQIAAHPHTGAPPSSSTLTTCTGPERTARGHPEREKKPAPTRDRPRFRLSLDRPQFSSGSIRSAKLVRARCNRLFTVPRFTPVISAISS